MNILIGSSFFVGVLSLIYYLIIILNAGIASTFGVFWLICGIAAIALGLIFRYIKMKAIRIPRAIRLLAGALFLFGAAVFLFIQGMISVYGNRKPQTGADYVIVLGGQVKGMIVTSSVKLRLDKALEYLGDNPSTKAIVTGGFEEGAQNSEAAAMEEYLVNGGIDRSRIMKEESATDTNENILYSAALIGHDKKVVIVSNRFHIFRAVSIAKKQGYQHVEGLAAPSDKIQAISCYVRESFAIIKEILVGNI